MRRLSSLMSCVAVAMAMSFKSRSVESFETASPASAVRPPIGAL
jgi:hypothetical protein